MLSFRIEAMRSFLLILRDIKIEHTLFAMPFALMSAFLAAGGIPPGREILLLIVAVVFARSAAMAFNRIADAGFDSSNPRTYGRPLASGQAGRAVYILFVAGASAGFIFSAWLLNPLAFLLSPVALGVIFFYSFTKRFTVWSHFFLGLALSLAPIGGWVAVKGEIGPESVALGLAVLFWLVGLDIIYSCQDIEHDRQAGLFSIPSGFGVERALRLSSLSHVVMICFLAIVWFLSPYLGVVYLVGLALTAAFLWYEHAIVGPDDLKKVNVAFFNLNGIISVGLMLFVIADTLV